MAIYEHAVEVHVPVKTAYNQWTQFEDFPHFMEGVESITQIDDTKLHWKAQIMGVTEEWDAVITEQLPDQRIAWTSTTGAKNAGVVTFHYIDENTTRVTLQIEYDPEGFVENVGATLGFVEGQMRSDLENFKTFIERRGEATGEWRGEVTQ